MKVPLLSLKQQYEEIRPEITESINEVLESQYFILGPRVNELEERIAGFCGTKYAVGVSSGTDALLASLMALGIGRGNEVMTTAYSFFATAGAISRVGATPVFIDIDPVSFNMDTSLIETRITPKTKAIMPVHLFGQCADMGKITAIAEKHSLYVIEDAAQAIGATYDGKRAGSFSHIGCFSFYVSKNLGAYGEAGMVVMDDEDLCTKVRMIRSHGENSRYFNELIGGNFRLDAIQAAVLLVKLKYLERWTEKRRRNAEAYNHLLKHLPVTTPVEINGNYMIYNQYVITTDKRDELMAFLKENDIATKIYYPVPMPLQTCYEGLGYTGNDIPNAVEAANTSLALPIYPELTRSQIEYVAGKIGEFLADA